MRSPYPESARKTPTECYAYCWDAHPVIRYVCLAFPDEAARDQFTQSVPYPNKVLYLESDTVYYHVTDLVDGKLVDRPCAVLCDVHGPGSTMMKW